MPALPAEFLALAESQEGALTGAQLRAGVRADQLTRFLVTGRLVRLWRDAYALPERAGSLSTKLRAAALTDANDLVPVLHTAAALHGFDLTDDARLHLLAVGWQSARPQVVLHRQTIHRPLVRLSGQAVLDPVETAVTVAAGAIDGPRSLAALDAAVRAGVRADLLIELSDSLRINGIVRARQATRWADAAAESPGESWLRWAILDGGLPPPVLQHWVRIASARYARLDLAWPDRRLACEYDGVAFHTGDRLFEDRARMNALSRLGWTVVHVTAAMVFSGRRALIAQLAHHLARPL